MACEDHDRRFSSATRSILQPMLSESYVSPRPASRVGTSSDAAKYLRRNRGSSSLWLAKRCGSVDLEDDDDDDELAGALTVRGCQTARPPRLNGDEASEIFRRSRGNVGTLLDETNQNGYSSPRAQPRLRSGDAEENARRNAGLVRKLFEVKVDDGQSSSRPQPRRVSAQGEANAARNAGTMKTLLKTDDRPRTSEVKAMRNKSALSLCIDGMAVAAGNGVSTPPPRQRVKPEGEENARKNAGTTCAAAMAGRLCGDPVRDVRASGAGRENYEAAKSGSIGALFSSYGQQSSMSSRTSLQERIPEGSGKEIAKHGKTGTLCFLMNNYGNLPNDPHPDSRLRSEGKRFVYRNRGNNMANCLNPATKPRSRLRSASYKRKTTK